MSEGVETVGAITFSLGMMFLGALLGMVAGGAALSSGTALVAATMACSGFASLLAKDAKLI